MAWGGPAGWRESSELKRTTDGLELTITRMEAGKQIVVKRYYRVASGLAVGGVEDIKDEQKAMVKDDQADASGTRKDSVERDSRGVDDDSAKVIEQPTQTKADEDVAHGEKAEVQYSTEIEQPQSAFEQEDIQPTEQVDVAADTEVVSAKEEADTSLEQVAEEGEEEEGEDEEEEEEQGEEERVEVEPRQAVRTAPLAAWDRRDDLKVSAPGEIYVELQSVQEAEEAEEEHGADVTTQPSPGLPLSSLTAAQPQPVVAAESRGTHVKQLEKEVEAVSSSVRTMQRSPQADVQQALWQRKDVWLVALIAFALLIVWNANRDSR